MQNNHIISDSGQGEAGLGREVIARDRVILGNGEAFGANRQGNIQLENRGLSAAEAVFELFVKFEGQA